MYAVVMRFETGEKDYKEENIDVTGTFSENHSILTIGKVSYVHVTFKDLDDKGITEILYDKENNKLYRTDGSPIIEDTDSLDLTKVNIKDGKQFSKDENTVNSNQNTADTNNEYDVYDVSMFEKLNTNEAVVKIRKENKVVLYIGRPTCGYSVQFLPNLQRAQKEYGYKTIYIDLDQMTTADKSNIMIVDNDKGYISEYLGATPMVLIYENGTLKDGWLGYDEYSKFASFLENNGYKK